MCLNQFRKFVYLLFVLTTFLSAEESKIPYLTSECDVLALVEGVVNAYNGKLIQIDQDIYIDGSDPLEMTRYYDGGHHFESEFGYGVGCSYPTLLKFYPLQGYATVELRQGFEVLCDLKKDSKKDKGCYKGSISKEYFKSGYTNCCEALLRGEPSIYAMEIEIDEERRDAWVNLGDGTKRYYAGYTGKWLSNNTHVFYFALREEKRPNNTLRTFSYNFVDEDNSQDPRINLDRIETCCSYNSKIKFNWLEFTDGDYGFTAKGSSGETAHYVLNNSKGKVRRQAKRPLHFHRDKISRKETLLVDASANHVPPTKYEYVDHTRSVGTLFSMEKIKTAGGRYLKVNYDKYQRVTDLYTSADRNPIYSFDYHPECTVVKDANGGKRKYEFSNRRLTKFIEDHRVQKYTWDEIGQLKTHTVLDSSETPVLRREYKYDKKGNILEIQLKGCIAAESSKDTYTISYNYAKERNLLLAENRNDALQYRYTYYPDTNLMTSKLTYASNKCVEREFNQYDKNGILICKIVDDGSEKEEGHLANVTYRKITEIEPQLDDKQYGMTLPKTIRESYLDPLTEQKHLLKLLKRTYTKGNRIAQEEVYDALGHHQYTLSYKYNKRLELVQETNALGEETLYDYDDNGNQIKKIQGGKETRFSYDEGNRLIEEKEIHSERTLRKTYDYDPMGNRTSSTDIYGQTTNYRYDLAGREIKVIDPLKNTESKSYDALGNILESTDADGYTTQTTCNILGKPLKITHPDGSCQKYAYNTQGDLIQEWFRDGSYVMNEVDYRGRVLIARTFSEGSTFLKTTHNEYKGLNLISETDALGNITHYRYDGAGRKIAKIVGRVETQYGYDSLNRLNRITCGNRVEVKKFDTLDQLIEEQIEDLAGTIFSKSEYAYDPLGNRTLVRIYEDPSHFTETTTIFNTQSLPILRRDALGQETQIHYVQTGHLETTIMDPTGRQKIEIFDALNRLKERKILSSSGILAAHCSFGYDKRGNQILQEEEILFNGLCQGQYKIATLFDSMNHKIQETEQDNRTTHWAYEHGRLKTITLANGVILTHAYDSLGRLLNQISSDGSIQYQFSYDLNDNLIEAKDLIQGATVLRNYDQHHHLVHEQQATGFTCDYNYDEQGRIVEMKFEGGSITYTYSPTTLTSASRFKNGELLYSCTQSSDWRGKIAKAALPHQTSIDYTWDALGRITSIDTTSFHQEYSYDPLGNLIQTQVKDLLGSYEAQYTYDALNQLLSETGPFEHQFAHDSIHNRLVHNGHTFKIDTFNQLLQDENDHYLYDLIGRKIAKGDASYSYDALGRLTKFTNNDQTITYTYDPLGRRIRQTSPECTQEYFYQFDIELGSTSPHHTEFRLLHNHATLAIELDNTFYAPIRNHRGDICQLLHPHENTTLRYDAFGNFDCHGTLPPWLFAGQRFDTHTQLYHFQKRPYDSSTGRWITPDPLHFTDGPNLYTYVHNNPLTFVDPYGLWKEETRDFFRGFSRGAVDDTTWNTSSFALGEFKASSGYGTWGYHIGTGASIVGGLFYGNTWAKVGAKGCTTLLKTSLNKTSANTILKRGSVRAVTKIEGTTAEKVSRTVKKSQNSPAKKPRDKKKYREENFPGTPDDLAKNSDWVEVTHPNQRLAGHRQFENQKTGDIIRYDKGKPTETGHERYDHYHRSNGNLSKREYFDYKGNVQKKTHDAVHLYPPDDTFWDF